MDQPVIECPIALRWMVSKEKLLNEGKEPVYSDDVKVPKIPGLTYYIGVALNGFGEEPSGQVECKMIVPEDEFTASYTFTLQSAQQKIVIKDDTFGKCFVGYKGILCSKEVLLDPQNGYFIDDFLTIDFKGSIKVAADYDSYVFESLIIPPPSRLLRLLWSDQNKDGTILSNGQYIKYHVTILSCFSSFFKNTVRHTIEDFDMDIIELAIEFCYERDIKSRITEENESQLLLFAEKYKIDDLKEFIETMMIQKLSVENIVKYSNFAFKSDLELLQDYCIARIIKFNEKKMFIKDIETLDENVFAEMGRRLTFPTSNVCY